MAVSARVKQMGRECIAARVRIVNRLVTQACDEALRPHGVRVALVNIVVALAAGGPATPTVLARRLALDKSTLSRDVDKLLEKGWVREEPSEDARSHTLHATDEGVAFLESIHPAWAVAQADLAERLGPALTGALREAVSRHWAEAG
jgi:DNA-binding MarR family transcriptional regulator